MLNKQTSIIKCSHFWSLAHSSVQSSSSSEMILCDVSSSLRVHRSSATSGVRYPFTTSLRRMIHTYNRQQNTYYCKQVQTVAVVSQPKGKKLGFFKEPSYPVNHQKRIFDRKEASFTGQGFCNKLETRLSVVFAVNLSPLFAFETYTASQRPLVDGWMVHLWGVCLMMLMCV